MSRFLQTALTLLALSVQAQADVTPYPASCRVQEIPVEGATIHVRIGGKGPAVVLLHGFGDTGDMWAPLAADLARDHTVVVPDLRGMGLSSIPDGGYDKKTQAGDIRAVLSALKIEHSVVIGHDIGTMVAFAYAARYPQFTERLVVMDAPVPGITPWNDIVRSPMLWHFDFGGPDMERLVAGRERIYLDRFWNEFAGTRAKIDDAQRRRQRHRSGDSGRRALVDGRSTGADHQGSPGFYRKVKNSHCLSPIHTSRFRHFDWGSIPQSKSFTLSRKHEPSEKVEAVVQGKGQEGQRQTGAEKAEIHQQG
jgi:pimeloyl-ACP methyl ester carboxylesterase